MNPKIDNKKKYKLPEKVFFCTKCVISNQRPNSAIEYQHKSHTKKATIAFDALGVCDACKVAEEKNLRSIGKKESAS